MPIYDYKCRACGHEWEEFTLSIHQAEEQEPEIECPECKSKEKDRKPPTSTSFELKGRGWAKDRYGR